MTFVLSAVVASGLLVGAVVVAAPSDRQDPLPSSNFLLEVEGMTSASFVEVSGIGCGMEVIEYREGTEDSTPRKIPGTTSCGPVVLTRGLTENRELWDWFQAVKDGTVDRRSASLVVLDHGRQEGARFNLDEAWPSEYEVGPFDASGGGGVAIERLVLQVEDVQRG